MPGHRLLVTAARQAVAAPVLRLWLSEHPCVHLRYKAYATKDEAKLALFDEFWATTQDDDRLWSND